MLDDDRTPTIERRFDRRTADLPPTMINEPRIWFDVMRHGSTIPPRRRPRTDETTRTQLDFALPALAIWAADHDSLREISRNDFLAILPPSGTPRAVLITGVRSIFRILKARKVVFTDPTYRVPGAKGETRQPLPVDLDTLRTIIDSDDPARAALGALVAFHALRTGDLETAHSYSSHAAARRLGDLLLRYPAPWLPADEWNSDWSNLAASETPWELRGLIEVREPSIAGDLATFLTLCLPYLETYADRGIYLQLNSAWAKALIDTRRRLDHRELDWSFLPTPAAAYLQRWVQGDISVIGSR